MVWWQVGNNPHRLIVDHSIDKYMHLYASINSTWISVKVLAVALNVSSHKSMQIIPRLDKQALNFNDDSLSKLILGGWFIISVITDAKHGISFNFY